MQVLIRRGKVKDVSSFPIWTGGETPKQLAPAYLGIVHVTGPRPGRDDSWDEYLVEMFDEDGKNLGPTANSFDTLEAALQDGASLGVEEWEVCEVELER